MAKLNIKKVSVNGDTRFDRVHQIARRSKENPLVASFSEGYKTIICGSVWKEDMEVLLPLINRQDEKIRFVIVPHEIKPEEIEAYRNKIDFKSSLYSENNVADSKVLFIDEMGLLASMYKHGDLAFVGGAYGSGLHNILEPASFGLPVFFGNKNYKKFNEAIRMLKMGTAFTISGTPELIELTDFFLYDEAKLKSIQKKINAFVQENIGATDRVFNFIEDNYLNI